MADAEQAAVGDVGFVQTVTLTEKDLQDAARLFRLISAGTPWANTRSVDVPIRSTGEPNSQDERISQAKAALSNRQMRARYFGRAMFAEPGWDILLLLYIAGSSGARQTVGHLAELIETPPTTVSRWISYLEKELLVARTDHPTDRRIVFIRLTEKGRNALDTFFNEMPV